MNESIDVLKTEDWFLERICQFLSGKENEENQEFNVGELAICVYAGKN